MAFYVVVEGSGEKYIYKRWIQFFNPSLSVYDSIKDAKGENDVYIVSGGGYPNIKKIICNAIKDVNEDENFNSLVISIDSEESSRLEKRDEIERLIFSEGITKSYKIIVQHCCIETWLLGNAALFTNSELKSSEFQVCVDYMDVTKENPEEMGAHPTLGLNRAQFANHYLKEIFKNRPDRSSYKKNKPRIVANSEYFFSLKERWENTGHICSFTSFLAAFSPTNKW